MESTQKTFLGRLHYGRRPGLTVLHFQLAHQTLSLWGFKLMSSWSGAMRSNQRPS